MHEPNFKATNSTVHCGTKGKVRRSPMSLGFGQIYAQSFMAVHQTVIEIFLSGPQW